MDFISELKKLNINIDSNCVDKFNIYYKFLVDYNEKTNLTSITQEDEVFLKHFYDSLTLSLALPAKKLSLCDVGAGAGFPSVPCAIVNENLDVTIIDSLNKRIKFLNELIEKINVSNVRAIHSRAEDFSKLKREFFDICTARAVARLNILAELCMPLVKQGGYFIAMKGSSGDEELEEAKVAIKKLGGKVKKVIDLQLPSNAGGRQIIVIEKIKKTPSEYPRSFSVIKNKPIK